MWIDLNYCEQKWHEFKRDDRDIVHALHVDGSKCVQAEYDLSDLDLSGLERLSPEE